MIKFTVPILTLIIISKESSQTNADIDSLIQKYSVNNKFQLDIFYENFKNTLNKSAVFDCFESNNQIIESSRISDQSDFLVLSSLLVSRLDQCYNANFSLKEPNITNELMNNSHFIDTFLKDFLNNAKSIDKKG